MVQLVTIDSRETGGRPGVLVDGREILDIVAGPGSMADTQWLPQSVVSVLAAGDDGIGQIRALAAAAAAAAPAERAALQATARLLPFPGTALLPPVRRPGLLLMLESLAEPLASAWIKNPNAVAAPDAAVALPPGGSERLRLGPRLAVVLGRPLYNAAPPAARRAIGGFTWLCDLAPLRGALTGGPGERQFPGACPLGPVIVTQDEFVAAPDVLARVNGHVVATARPVEDLAAVPAVLAAISTAYALRPGDVVALPTAVATASAGRGDRCSVVVAGYPELAFTIA